MKLRQPIAVNKLEKPVIIYKNNEELKEFSSIQTAAKWLKEYLDYKTVPYTRLMNGIIHGEVWKLNGDSYAFTTDENVRLAKLEELTPNSNKVKPTGYWTFFCNPKKWAIDEFLKSGEIFDTFSITEWQKDWFQKGQLGIIRVGHDKRTLKQLEGNPRLNVGVYAVVEILNSPIIIPTKKEDYWLESDEIDEGRFRVEIKYLKNLLNTPILIKDFNVASLEMDKYLIDGFQASSMPLNPKTFNFIIDEIGGFESLNFDFNTTEINSEIHISEIEHKYIEAVPEVKERISKFIERGSIAKQYKVKTGFKCQVCESLGLDPYSFKKTNGEYYVETHHVIPVSKLQVGSLATNNLITVCANHHRQLHYGNTEIIENSINRFVFNVDNKIVEVLKIKD